MKFYQDNSFLTFPNPYQGSCGLNYYYGNYKSDNANNLTFGKFRVTLLDGSSEIMNYESKYCSSLRLAKKFEIQNNLLTIYYEQEGKLLYVFKK